MLNLYAVITGFVDSSRKMGGVNQRGSGKKKKKPAFVEHLLKTSVLGILIVPFHRWGY